MSNIEQRLQILETKALNSKPITDLDNLIELASSGDLLVVYSGIAQKPTKTDLQNLIALLGLEPTNYVNTNNSPFTIGGFLQNQQITPATGLTDKQFKDKLFSNIVLPTVAFNVNNETIEVGSVYDVKINIIFNQNDAGNFISQVIQRNGVDITTQQPPNQPTAFLENNVIASFTLRAFVTYGSSTSISSGTISTPLRTITPKYKYWVYSGALNSSPTTSGNIRPLTNNGFVPINNTSIVIPQGDTEVSIYIKETSTLQSVLYVESSNANITANFTESLVTVNDANGTPVQYKKLTQSIGGVGYTQNATYLITITE